MESVPLGYFGFPKSFFDTVAHCVLLDKLYMYGTTLESFSGNLSNRYQYAEYNDCKSNRKLIKGRALQGSSLGQLLFLISINVLPSVSKLLKILFVNNIKLFCAVDNLDLLIGRISVEMAIVYAWIKVNKLCTYNNFILFTPNQWSHSMNILNDGCKINEVEETKFLVVVIDNTFKWSRHLNTPVAKLLKALVLASKLVGYSPQSTPI